MLKAPNWITVLHDSFRLSPLLWGGNYLKNCDQYAVDTHVYQAWMPADVPAAFQGSACGDGFNIQNMEQDNVPVIVGEWSLATDNCAMWLNGFNDNVSSKFYLTNK